MTSLGKRQIHTDAFGGDCLDASPAVEIDRMDRGGWYTVMNGFDDANIFQAWDFGRIAHPGRDLSHIVLRRDGQPVAAAQLLVRRVPGIGGIALVMWGPLWRPKGRQADPADFLAIMDAMKAEYSVRRGLFLRVLPRVEDGAGEGARALSAMEALGMRHSDAKAPYRTFIMDLTRDEATIHKDLSRHWRRGLAKAEGAGLEIVEGSAPEILDAIDDLFIQTQRRKGFRAFDSRTLTKVHRALPDGMKMHAVMASHNGEPVAGVVVSLLGDTALMQNSATAEAGLPLNAAFLVHWKAMQWVKANGGKRYDLHGVNAQVNPGVHLFKRGFAGKGEEERVFIGTFEAPGPMLSRLLVEGGQTVRTLAATCTAQASQMMAMAMNKGPAERADATTPSNPA
ncbi:GNAT family N-acetyltransferase [Azospirillum brasilense]|nr:GNAT family N-acetyltransferase [Azospirillum brasilense]NUB34686.1 GNAT family N-acetyltransferase [Azospirillum brasilense]RIV94795.1 GNAT family N-acetyltransferase [Azospirillum brasilense]